jgi:hypothetical protein
MQQNERLFETTKSRNSNLRVFALRQIRLEFCFKKIVLAENAI